MLGWGAAYVPAAWLVEDWPPLIAAGVRLTVAGWWPCAAGPRGGW